MMTDRYLDPPVVEVGRSRDRPLWDRWEWLALPLYLVDGVTPFPFRDLILFLTFAVILMTLVGQGLMLPWVIRALGLAHVGRGEGHTERAEEHMARRQAITAAVERLDQLAAEAAQGWQLSYDVK
jgi:hypothetical protein